MFKNLMILLAVVAATALTGHATAQDAAAWQEGTHYFAIDPPQPVSTGSKVEVLEVFSYACPHCASFQPYVGEIDESLPAGAQLRQLPAIFNPSWESFARAYFTAQSLGVLESTHQQLFDALHVEHRQMRDFDALADFYAARGVDKDRFITTAHSFEVENKLAGARAQLPKLGIEGTPTMIVNGKYRITGASAGGYPQVVELVQWLVEQELATAGAAP